MVIMVRNELLPLVYLKDLFDIELGDDLMTSTTLLERNWKS